MRLSLIVRCVVCAAACACVICGLFVAVNVISDYPFADVVPAMLFGMFEAAVVGGMAGSLAGLLMGILAYLTRGAIRGMARRSY